MWLPQTLAQLERLIVSPTMKLEEIGEVTQIEEIVAEVEGEIKVIDPFVRFVESWVMFHLYVTIDTTKATWDPHQIQIQIRTTHTTIHILPTTPSLPLLIL